MSEQDKKKLSKNLKQYFNNKYDENNYINSDDDNKNLNNPSYTEHTLQSINQMGDPSKFLSGLLTFKDPQKQNTTIDITNDIDIMLGKTNSVSSSIASSNIPTQVASPSRPSSASINKTPSNNQKQKSNVISAKKPFRFKGGKKRNLTFKKRR